MSISPDAVAAFIAGASSIVGGMFAIKRARREEKEHCEQRISDIREAFNAGLIVRERIDE